MGDRGRNKRWWRRRNAGSAVFAERESSGAPDQPLPARTEGDKSDQAVTELPVTEAPARQPDMSAADRLWMRRYVQVQLRTGLYDDAQLHEMVARATASRIGDRADAANADDAVRESLAVERAAWYAEAAQWVGRTDPERLDAALQRVSDKGMVVVAAAADEAAMETGRELRDSPSGVIGYTTAGVAAAVRDFRLTLAMRAPDGTPARRGGDLCGLVEDALADEGLLASAAGQDGELIVAMSWRRRPAGNLSNGAAAQDRGSQGQVAAAAERATATDSRPEDST